MKNAHLTDIPRYLSVVRTLVAGDALPVTDDGGWGVTADPLMDFLVRFFADDVIRQGLCDSRIRRRVVYDCVGRFVVSVVHHVRFQLQRAWTERNDMTQVLNWTDARRGDVESRRALIEEIWSKHIDDGFDRRFFIRLLDGDGALRQENWEKLVDDWQRALRHGVCRETEAFITADNGHLNRTIENVVRQVENHLERNDISDEEAAEAWDQMTGQWTESEFEKKLRQMRVQEQYPALHRIVGRMGRSASASGDDRLAVAVGGDMKIEHSAGSDIEGVTTGNDLNALLPLELAEYCDEDTEELFAYKYRTRSLQTFRYKSEQTSPNRRLSFVHARRKGPMIVCLDTSASMYGLPQRIESCLLAMVEQRAEDEERDCFLIDFSVGVRPIDLVAKRRLQEEHRLGMTAADRAGTQPVLTPGRSAVAEQPGAVDVRLPFIGGGSSARNLLNTLFGLLDNSGSPYVNADVLMVSDFLIPLPPEEYLRRMRRYHESGTRFHGLRITQTNTAPPDDTPDWTPLFDTMETIRYRQLRRY